MKQRAKEARNRRADYQAWRSRQFRKRTRVKPTAEERRRLNRMDYEEGSAYSDD